MLAKVPPIFLEPPLGPASGSGRILVDDDVRQRECLADRQFDPIGGGMRLAQREFRIEFEMQLDNLHRARLAGTQVVQARITSYNVCYTKLLR